MPTPAMDNNAVWTPREMLVSAVVSGKRLHLAKLQEGLWNAEEQHVMVLSSHQCSIEQQ